MKNKIVLRFYITPVSKTYRQIQVYSMKELDKMVKALKQEAPVPKPAEAKINDLNAGLHSNEARHRSKQMI